MSDEHVGILKIKKDNGEVLEATLSGLAIAREIDCEVTVGGLEDSLNFSDIDTEVLEDAD